MGNRIRNQPALRVSQDVYTVAVRDGDDALDDVKHSRGIRRCASASIDADWHNASEHTVANAQASGAV